MWAWIKKVIRSRYVVLLEEEVGRLRAENRALMNSLLGTAGFPPVEFGDGAKPVMAPRLRRRSWQQVQAMKEGQAGREVSGDS